MMRLLERSTAATFSRSKPTNGFYLIFLLIIDSVASLKCWHCIYDNCDMPPQDNRKAEERVCLEGQFCQKVFFQMYSTIDHTEHVSTVRGCAWDCKDKNDFQNNCTEEISTRIGCVIKSCCNNADLCNHGDSVHKNSAGFVLLLLCLKLLSRF